MSLVLVFVSVFGVKGANLKKNRMEVAAAKKNEANTNAGTFHIPRPKGPAKKM
jgi:hypothetical protein